VNAIERQASPNVGLARRTNSEIGRLAAAVVAVSDDVRAMLLTIAKMLDVEPALPETNDAINWARRRAGAEDTQAGIDRLLMQMEESRRAAERQSGLPTPRRRDGSQPRPVSGDHADVDRAEFIASHGYGQIARHAEMARGKVPDPSWDARPETREIREAMYAKLGKDD
jgi:hypothetical protein